MKLAQQVAVVTGGGQGIGREISLCLAKNGAQVVIADIGMEAAEQTARDIVERYGVIATAQRVDVSREEEITAVMWAISDAFGRLDIVVNNSGVAGPMGPTESVSLEDWQKADAINVEGVFLMCKHAIPLLRKNGKGSIVNIASISAKRPLLERVSYCAGKAAVIGMTRSLALECGKWGIRVNAVCPGAVDGPRQRAILEHAAAAQGKSYEEAAALKKAASPLHTFVPPESLAGVVAFLCSEEAAMMTGQDINVSAGVWMS